MKYVEKEFERLRGILSGQTLNLPILYSEFLSIGNTEEADLFFQKYGVGNLDSKIIDRPFERVRAYEFLLMMLYQKSKEKFYHIHKGTPFYFLSWSAFQYEDFEKSLFYMDASITEDEKSYGDSETLSKNFFLLNSNSLAHPSVNTLHDKAKFIINSHLKNFNHEFNIKDFNIEKFTNNFVRVFLSEKSHRTILTAFYGFVLKNEVLDRQNKLRSINGGTIEPFINHLFEGSRVLESILKIFRQILHDKKSPKIHLSNLKSTLEDPILRKKLGFSNANEITNGNGKTLENAIERYNNKSDNENILVTSFAITYIVRNSTGHSLIWDDVFVNTEDYENLKKCVLYSILLSIYKCST